MDHLSVNCSWIARSLNTLFKLVVIKCHIQYVYIFPRNTVLRNFQKRAIQTTRESSGPRHMRQPFGYHSVYLFEWRILYFLFLLAYLVQFLIIEKNNEIRALLYLRKSQNCIIRLNNKVTYIGWRPKNIRIDNFFRVICLDYSNKSLRQTASCSASKPSIYH